MAYAISPFEGATIEQLVNSIKHLSFEDYHLGETSIRPEVIKLDAQHLAQKKRKQTIRSSIQQAITSNQFKLFFQPKVRLDNGLVESAEVLMRWQHSSLGWVSPNEFISLSELDGQIMQVGSWLLENSVAQLMAMRKQYGNNLSLSINVSPRQLQSEQMVHELSYLLAETQIEPSCIELELTEGCVIKDLGQTASILNQLKALGVRIAIDDFGAGYATFAYLSKLPIDLLKLDKVLVDDIESNEDVINMLQSIIQLCKKMGIEVVAEGAENQRQVDILRGLQCDYVQGFVYSRPVTKSQFEKILINQPYQLMQLTDC